MQDKFIRKAGIFRNDLKDSKEEEEKKDEALFLISEMGFIEEIETKVQHPEYFILFGASKERFTRRLTDFLDKSSRNIIKPKHIIILGSSNKYVKSSEIKEIKKEISNEQLRSLMLKVEKNKLTALSEIDLIKFIWNIIVPPLIYLL